MTILMSKIWTHTEEIAKESDPIARFKERIRILKDGRNNTMIILLSQLDEIRRTIANLNKVIENLEKEQNRYEAYLDSLTY